MVASTIVLAGTTFPEAGYQHRYRPVSHVGFYRQRYQLSRVGIGWGGGRAPFAEPQHPRCHQDTDITASEWVDVFW